MKIKSFVNLFFLALVISATAAHLLRPPHAGAICEEENFPGIIEVIDRFNWDCMFPVRIGGSDIGSYDPGESDVNIDEVLKNVEDIKNSVMTSPTPSDSSDIFCKCDSAGAITRTQLGIRFGFREPSRIIESVKDSWCFPVLGKDMGDDMGDDSQEELNRNKDGARSRNWGSQLQLWNGHLYVFPVLAILELLTDFICMDYSAFDLAYATEVDPRWTDSELSAVLSPEAVLFANPLAQMACVPDAVAATIGKTVNALYWCQGGWAKTFPMTGYITTSGLQIQSATAAMGRVMFLLHRSFVMWGTMGDDALCHRYPMYTWKKSQYLWQSLLPVRDTSCRVIGQPGFMWTSYKNPPFPNYNPDNFAYGLWRWRDCCAR